MIQTLNIFPEVAWSALYGYYAGITDTYMGVTEQGWKFQFAFSKVTGWNDKLKIAKTDWSFASVFLISPSGRFFNRSYFFAGTGEKDLLAVANGFFSEYQLWPVGVYNSEVSFGVIKEPYKA